MGNGVSGEGGAASSGSPPYASVEEAREAGRTQEEIDAYLAAKAATEAQPVDLTEAETVAVKLMFEQVDADANGMIDLKELTELFSTLGYLEDEVGPLSQQYMEKFDLVGNKELDFDAFIKLYGSLKASEGHRIEKYHNDVEEAEKEAARRLANRVARAKDPDFDARQEEELKQAAHEKTIKRAATKRAEKTPTEASDPDGSAEPKAETAAATTAEATAAESTTEKPAAAEPS